MWGICGCWKGLHTWKSLEGEVPVGQFSDRRRRLLWLGSQGCNSTAACFSGRREGLKVQKYQVWCIHVSFLSFYRQSLTTPNIVSTGKGAEEQDCSILHKWTPANSCSLNQNLSTYGKQPARLICKPVLKDLWKLLWDHGGIKEVSLSFSWMVTKRASCLVSLPPPTSLLFFWFFLSS